MVEEKVEGEAEVEGEEKKTKLILLIGGTELEVEVAKKLV